MIKFTDAEYEEAEKKVNLILASRNKNFKNMLLDSIFLQINNPLNEFTDSQMMELYTIVSNINNNSSDGLKAIEDFKQEYIIKFIGDQKRHELEN